MTGVAGGVGLGWLGLWFAGFLVSSFCLDLHGWALLF